MSDLPLSLPAALDPAYVDSIDPPGKIAAALESLGPVAGRDVLVVDAAGGPIVRALNLAGARVTHIALARPLRLQAPDASVDVVLGLWSAFRGVAGPELAEVNRVLRPEGRHLVVHEYGRDDVSRLVGNRPEYGAWSQRTGPFLTGGFRVRVLHCFWEFDTPEATNAFLARVFGRTGQRVAETLKRPRLSWNVAVYHRSRP